MWRPCFPHATNNKESLNAGSCGDNRPPPPPFFLVKAGTNPRPLSLSTDLRHFKFSPSPQSLSALFVRGSAFVASLVGKVKAQRSYYFRFLLLLRFRLCSFFFLQRKRLEQLFKEVSSSA